MTKLKHTFSHFVAFVGCIPIVLLNASIVNFWKPLGAIKSCDFQGSVLGLQNNLLVLSREWMGMAEWDDYY
jgi:hypothetical protein